MTSFSGSQPMVAEKYKTALVGWWSIFCIFANLYMAMQSLSNYTKMQIWMIRRTI